MKLDFFIAPTFIKAQLMLCQHHDFIPLTLVEPITMKVLLNKFFIAAKNFLTRYSLNVILGISYKISFSLRWKICLIKLSYFVFKLVPLKSTGWNNDADITLIVL